MLAIRQAQLNDLPRLVAIYNQAVVNTTATFDLEPVSTDERRPWFLAHGDRYPLLVIEDQRRVLGYACISPYQRKPAYATTVESSVYIDEQHHGQGIGTLLMQELLRHTARLGYHSVLAIITGSNKGSIRLHQKLGFQQVACLKEVGYKFGAWQDVYFYQLMLHPET